MKTNHDSEATEMQKRFNEQRSRERNERMSTQEYAQLWCDPMHRTINSAFSTIADLNCQPNDATCKSYGVLLAAAPELLEFVTACAGGYPVDPKAAQMLVKKATQ